MAILETEIMIKLPHAKIKYFELLGYEIPRHIDNQGKLRFTTGSQILVKVEHLTKGSHVEVTKICDDCGKRIPNQKYSNIINSRNRGDGKDRCSKCGHLFARSNFKDNVQYERSLEYFAKENNKEYLLKEFSLKNNKKPREIYFSTSDKYLWDCGKCGSEFDMSVGNRTGSNDCNCPFCAGYRVNHTNCLWTTHPEIAKMLKNPQRGYKIIAGSGKKEKFICPNCNHENTKTINSVTNNGLSCSRCSDGISYPEKFIMDLLNQLNVDFETQKIFKWNNGKRYDIYIEKLKCIIEIHGGHHYKDAFYRTMKQVQENDRIKEKLALENQVKIYIVIDARESNMEFIKNSVIESEISSLFNLSRVNWLQCHSFAFNNSFLRIICDLWNSGINSVESICKITKLGERIVYRCLKQGKILKICDYNPDEIKKQTAIKNSIRSKREIVQLTTDDEIIKIWDSVSDASKKNGLSITNISNVITGRNKTAGGFKWMYKGEYEKCFKNKTYK